MDQLKAIEDYEVFEQILNKNIESIIYKICIINLWICDNLWFELDTNLIQIYINLLECLFNKKIILKNYKFTNLKI